MANAVLSDPRFFSEEAAFEYVEAQLWPNGPVCPHCGATAEKIGRLAGRAFQAHEEASGGRRYHRPAQMLRLPSLALYGAQGHDF